MQRRHYVKLVNEMSEQRSSGVGKHLRRLKTVDAFNTANDIAEHFIQSRKDPVEISHQGVAEFFRDFGCKVELNNGFYKIWR